MAETVGAVQFGLALRPFDGALQPATQKTLEKQKDTKRGHSASGATGWIKINN